MQLVRTSIDGNQVLRSENLEHTLSHTGVIGNKHFGARQSRIPWNTAGGEHSGKSGQMTIDRREQKR